MNVYIHVCTSLLMCMYKQKSLYGKRLEMFNTAKTHKKICGYRWILHISLDMLLV